MPQFLPKSANAKIIFSKDRFVKDRFVKDRLFTAIGVFDRPSRQEALPQGQDWLRGAPAIALLLSLTGRATPRLEDRIGALSRWSFPPSDQSW
jgi:hypothetical protein